MFLSFEYISLASCNSGRLIERFRTSESIFVVTSSTKSVNALYTGVPAFHPFRSPASSAPMIFFSSKASANVLGTVISSSRFTSCEYPSCPLRVLRFVFTARAIFPYVSPKSIVPHPISSIASPICFPYLSIASTIVRTAEGIVSKSHSIFPVLWSSHIFSRPSSAFFGVTSNAFSLLPIEVGLIAVLASLVSSVFPKASGTVAFLKSPRYHCAAFSVKVSVRSGISIISPVLVTHGAAAFSAPLAADTQISSIIGSPVSTSIRKERSAFRSHPTPCTPACCTHSKSLSHARSIAQGIHAIFPACDPTAHFAPCTAHCTAHVTPVAPAFAPCAAFVAAPAPTKFARTSAVTPTFQRNLCVSGSSSSHTFFHSPYAVFAVSIICFWVSGDSSSNPSCAVCPTIPEIGEKNVSSVPAAPRIAPSANVFSHIATSSHAFWILSKPPINEPLVFSKAPPRNDCSSCGCGTHCTCSVDTCCGCCAKSSG